VTADLRILEYDELLLEAKDLRKPSTVTTADALRHAIVDYWVNRPPHLYISTAKVLH